MEKHATFITAPKAGTNSVAVTDPETIDFDKITLTNDIMFSSVFHDPEYCRELLQRILDIEITELEISEDQKSIRVKPWHKGIRLDIYVKDINGNVYDIEMQVFNAGDLPLRSRYYHSEMDSYQILRGQDYIELKASIVIFLCSFDLFGQNRSIYTFQSLCREDPDISLKDNRQTIFVNIEGDRTGLSPELISFLDYLKTTEPTDDFTTSLNSKVKRLRNDLDWRENYMTLERKMEERFKAGIEVGREQGKAQTLKDMTLKKLAKGKSIPQIAEECEESIETIQFLITEMERENS